MKISTLMIALATIAIAATTTFAQFGGGSNPPVYPYGYEHMYDPQATGKIVVIGGGLTGEDYFYPDGMDSPFDYPYVKLSDPFYFFPAYDPMDDFLTITMEYMTDQKEDIFNANSELLMDCFIAAAEFGPPSPEDIAACIATFGDSVGCIINPANDPLQFTDCDGILDPDYYETLTDYDEDETSIPVGGMGGTLCGNFICPYLHYRDITPSLIVNTSNVQAEYAAAYWLFVAKLKGLQFAYYIDLNEPTTDWATTVSNWEYGYTISFQEFIDDCLAATPGS